jgi:hypothetical protein
MIEIEDNISVLYIHGILIGPRAIRGIKSCNLHHIFELSDKIGSIHILGINKNIIS